MSNEINVNEIVKIEQMPKVFSQLELIGRYIDEQVKDIDKLECNEENKQEVKKRRTEINNTLKLLDDKRKEIKTTLLEPYEVFNQKYEEECKNKLIEASTILKAKIDDIENNQKQQKIEEVQEFFDRQVEARGLNKWFENNQDIKPVLGMNITLSASMKSIKDSIIERLDGLEETFKLIELEEHSDEILVEFKKNGDFAKSKMEVLERHKQLEALKEQKEERKEIEEQEQKIEEKVEAVIEPPKEIIEDEDIITVQFTIKDTKANVLKVREFMKEEGIKYE